MFDSLVLPWLREAASGRVVKTRVLRIVGLGESHVEQLVAPVYRSFTNPRTTILGGPGQVELHLTAEASSEDLAHARIEELASRLRVLLGWRLFSEDGRGEQLSADDLLVRILRKYDIETTSSDLKWHAQAFWAQSMQWKLELGWVPPTAGEFPRRVYEALSLALGRNPEELRSLMDRLINEWKRQAKKVLAKFGYEAPW